MWLGKMRYLSLLLLVFSQLSFSAPEGSVKAVSADNDKPVFLKNLGFGYMSWREPLTINSTTKVKGVSSFNGYYLRYELLRPKIGIDWGLAFLFFSGGADAKSNDSSSYLVNRVDTNALAFAPFVYFKLESDVYLKLSFDLTMKNINWPKVGGVNGANSNPLTFGPVMGLSYKLDKDLFIDQKVGSYAISGDIVWQVGLSYRL